jgi:DNA-binding GntR family transcriptional regulator
MFRKIIFFIIYMTLALGALTANGEVDEDFMKTMEDLNKSLSSDIAIKDVKAASSEAREMEKMFVEVEAHFVKKADAADGVKWSQESRELSAAILKNITANDFDAAEATATSLSKTCKACHKIYKKKD